MKEWGQVWTETFGRDWRNDVQDRLHRQRLDNATRACSAFRDFDDLLFSMNNHNYVPTLRQYRDSPQRDAAVRTVRKALIEMGLTVYPPPPSKEDD
jgi:hypothetical protein